MIFGFYIFDRKGTCLWSRQWKRLSRTKETEGDITLMYGMLFSLKKFVSRINPRGGPSVFQSFKTRSYKLHCFESLTGLKFVLTTDLAVENVNRDLKELYRTIFVEYVTKSSIYKLGDPIDSKIFEDSLTSFVQALPYYA